GARVAGDLATTAAEVLDGVLRLPVGDAELGEAVDVARDRVLRIDAVALLHPVEAHVEIVVLRAVVAVESRARLAVLARSGAVRVVADGLAGRLVRVALRGEAAGRAALVARIALAHGRAARRGRPVGLGASEDARAGELLVHERPTLAADGERV